LGLDEGKGELMTVFVEHPEETELLFKAGMEVLLCCVNISQRNHLTALTSLLKFSLS